MKIEINKEQLEILKYAILWYESNDEEEERIVNELEEKLYNAQEQDLLRSFTIWEDLTNGTKHTTQCNTFGGSNKCYS